MVASAYILRLKKVHKKVRLKEYLLIKQGLRELKDKKAKIGSSLVIMETVYTLVVEFSSKVYPSLIDSFTFNSSYPFSPLLDLFSSNTP